MKPLLLLLRAFPCKKGAFVEESLQKASLAAEGLSLQKGDKEFLREAFAAAAAEGLPL